MRARLVNETALTTSQAIVTVADESPAFPKVPGSNKLRRERSVRGSRCQWSGNPKEEG